MGALAWRNVWRKKGRSLLAIGAVATVVLLTLVYFAFGGAVSNAMYTSLTDTSGHLQVHVEGYRDQREFADLLLHDAAAVRAALSEVAPEGQIVSVLEVPGLLEGDGRSRGIAFQGVERPEALQTSYADDVLLEGWLPASPEEIALSAGLARAVDVARGDTVYAYAPGTEGYGAAAYTVVGLLDLPAGVHMAQLSLAAAQELAAPDAATRFELHLPAFVRKEDDAALPALTARLRERLGAGYAVETWAAVNPGLASYMEVLVPLQTVATAVFFVLGGLLVTNTIYLSVIERVREFGVIQALGASGRRVMGMVLAESLVVCAVGAVVGTVSGLLVVARMAQGFGFSGDLGVYMESFGIPRVMYASLTANHVLITVAFTVATALLAAIIPARTATHLEPIEAIRFTA